MRSTGRPDRPGFAWLVVMTGCITGTALAQDTQLLWGDLHLHTSYSSDAYSTANRSVTPDMAYRYARGIPIVQAQTGIKIQIARPLDFLAVTDHAINMGIDAFARRSDEFLATTEGGRALLEQRAQAEEWLGGRGGGRGRGANPNAAAIQRDTHSAEFKSRVWEDEVAAAEANYVPGEFTTFVAWEWTSLVDQPLKNLHRCIITDADGVSGNRFIPFSNADSTRPEDLFEFLGDASERTGIDFIAIPHNSNLSGGLMFDTVDSDGRPIDAAYARERAVWEELVEITQAKGTSEVHPELAPTDEFAEFEIRRKLLAGQPTPASAGDYVRNALLRGISFQDSIGANPYKYGFVGATDNHTGTTTFDEDNFLGKLASDITLASRAAQQRPIFPAWEMSASGITGVWATENTRESIFAALKRKEVYATTGTRIQVRVFGGFAFDEADARAADLAGIGYARGVPMGGDLTGARRGQAPRLLIHAAMDPLSGNLDRVQVIKGWVDDSGESHERIYEAAWSGDRRPGADGKLPPVGNTVDLGTGLYRNTIGAPQLATVWEDPDFDPAQTAFYYVRVLEIPTPRHSLFDAIALGIDPAETGAAATIQERAYSSPIWYTP